MKSMTKFQMKSIQTKLTLIMLAIVLVSLCTLGGLNYWKARSIVTDTILENMQDQAVDTATAAGSWLGLHGNELTMIASNPTLASGNIEAILPAIQAAQKSNKDYETITYITAAGEATENTGNKASVPTREYFKQAMQGKTFITDPFVSKTLNRPVVVIAVPIKAESKVVGVLLGVVNMNALQEFVSSVKVGDTGYAYINQQDGLTIAHPNKDVTMKLNALKDSSTPDNLRVLNERMGRGEKGVTYYDYNGATKAVAFAPIPGVNWSLGVTVPLAEVTGAVSTLTWISVITTVIILILAAIVVAWYARRVAKPLQELEVAVKGIADGDLTQEVVRIDSNDEIGRLSQSFGQMAENLRTIIQKISVATEQVSAASEELTASAEQSAQAVTQVAESIGEIAMGAESQLKAVTETSAVVEQMSAGTQQAAASTNEVAVGSAQAADKAKMGMASVEKAVSQMTNIEQSVNKSAEVVAKLGGRSKEIGQIVDTIAGIAGQTNLLALNAAIEAARAGEQGRGFAVVAEEVRKLAEQSQEATKQIADLIGVIQGDTDEAVATMDAGTREVRVGSEVVAAAGQAFAEIAVLVDNVSRQVKEISTAMQQMATGSQQIVSSVQVIDEYSKAGAEKSQTISAATEEQSASMEEIAASSQSLAKLAEDLQVAVSQFRL